MSQHVNFNTKKTPLWIVSDTHFHHDREFLWKPRGYSDIQSHDEGVKKNWNNLVGKDDNVLCLGDFVFNDPDGSRFKQLLSELNGYIYLLWGNHNSGVKAVYKSEVLRQYGSALVEVYPLAYGNKVMFLGDYVLGRIDGVPYVASHFPFRIWDEMQHGSIALSGHSHGNDEGRNPKALDDKALDCGIDNFGGPVSFQDVMEIIRGKQTVVIDHHDKNTLSGH